MTGNVLCAECTTTSAPKCIALLGKGAPNDKCAPCASSTSTGIPFSMS